MKKIFGLIKEVVMWLIIISAFAMIGVTTEAPVKNGIMWAVIAIVLFGGGFILAKFRKRHTGTTKAHLIIKKIAGAILLIFGILLPILVFKSFPVNTKLLIIAFAIGLVALGTLAVQLIKKSVGGAIIGYIMLFILAFLPALLMSTYDMTYNAMGTTYYLTIALACLSWAGISLITAKKLD